MRLQSFNPHFSLLLFLPHSYHRKSQIKEDPGKRKICIYPLKDKSKSQTSLSYSERSERERWKRIWHLTFGCTCDHPHTQINICQHTKKILTHLQFSVRYFQSHTHTHTQSHSLTVSLSPPPFLSPYMYGGWGSSMLKEFIHTLKMTSAASKEKGCLRERRKYEKTLSMYIFDIIVSDCLQQLYLIFRLGFSHLHLQIICGHKCTYTLHTYSIFMLLCSPSLFVLNNWEYLVEFVHRLRRWRFGILIEVSFPQSMRQLRKWGSWMIWFHMGRMLCVTVQIKAVQAFKEAHTYVTNWRFGEIKWEGRREERVFDGESVREWEANNVNSHPNKRKDITNFHQKKLSFTCYLLHISFPYV